MKAQDIMARNPRCVTPQTSVREAARLMQSEDVGALPVVQDEGSRKLVGMITDRDIAIRVVAEGKNGEQTKVSEIMSGGRLATARADDDVEQVMKTMGREQVRRIPIVDDREQLLGVVSQADVVRKAKDDDRAEETVEQISKPGGRHNEAR